MRCHQRNHAAGIQSTRQERAQRHVAYQTNADCLVELFSDYGGRFLKADPMLREVLEFPVGSRGYPALFEDHEMSGRHFLDVSESGEGRRNVTEDEVRGDCAWVDGARDERMREQRLYFRSEQKCLAKVGV